MFPMSTGSESSTRGVYGIQPVDFASLSVIDRRNRIPPRIARIRLDHNGAQFDHPPSLVNASRATLGNALALTPAR